MAQEEHYTPRVGPQAPLKMCAFLPFHDARLPGLRRSSCPSYAARYPVSEHPSVHIGKDLVLPTDPAISAVLLLLEPISLWRQRPHAERVGAAASSTSVSARARPRCLEAASAGAAPGGGLGGA